MPTVNGRSSGGSATPGGSNTQLQQNNSGTFGGTTGVTYNSTSQGLTIGGATTTTATSALTVSQTYNNAGITFPGAAVIDVTNTASNSNSAILDVKRSGTSLLTVNTGGSLIANTPIICTGYMTLDYYLVAGTRIYMRSDTNPLTLGASDDVALYRHAANILGQRNSTNAQAYYLFNTYTSSTSNEYLKLAWESNTAIIGTIKGSGGGSARGLALQTDGTTRISIGATGSIGFFGASAVAQPSTTGTATGFTAGAGTNVTDQSTFTGGTGTTAYRISDIVLALKQLGLLAA